MPELTAAGDSATLPRKIAGILDECRLSHAIHGRKLKELSSLRSSTSPRPRSLFFSSFVKALTPLFDFARRTVSSERVVRFVSAFAARRDEKDARVSDEFLEEFIGFLLMAARAGQRSARFRACQIVSEIIMRLPDDAEVSNEVWDEVIDNMKQRVEDKVPAIRGFAVRALSRFANDVENSDIISLFLQVLPEESNAEVRKTIVLSLPPSNDTATAIVSSMLDVSDAVRRAAYCVLASKFPLQSLSIKLRTTVLQRGLSDRSLSVTKECLRMLKDEWLMKCCGGDPIALLRFLDVETYEIVGETIMEVILKDGVARVQEGQSIRQYLASRDKGEGKYFLIYNVFFGCSALYEL
ncbi:condensin complex subunit 3-like [Asparagus officinalis]|uniref:condensin complex subunit 3-like n=1 Tax=Asparagus officinalis TaxID=4686 RepID=UPI00098E0C69|nr:condensin complex subunit 3-like [Asparagus officinalis]